MTPITDPEPWPVLTRYTSEKLLHIAMPLGGIGTGTVSLAGRGDLRDWEIANRPAKGFTPTHSFFVLRVRSGSEPPIARVLEGSIDPVLYEGEGGCTVPQHGLPRFRSCTFEAAYPFARVRLADDDVPLKVDLEAFNPLIPADAEASGIPAAVLRFVLQNPTSSTCEATVCGNLKNFIGNDGQARLARKNINAFRKEGTLSGLFMQTSGVDPQAESWGTLALAVLGQADVTHRLAWRDFSWGDAMLDFWDELLNQGRVSESGIVSQHDKPVGSLAACVEIPPGATVGITYLLTWHFPNRKTWTPRETNCNEPGSCEAGPASSDLIGNYYTTRYTDAWDVVEKTAADLTALESGTRTFVSSFLASDMPHELKEAALFNLSTLRSQTCFRTPDGKLFGWEGCYDQTGCCLGSCTHVWNYEQATPFLFGSLAQSMREVEYLHGMRDDGHMSFRVQLPLEHGNEHGLAAADGQMGCLMKLYREWQLSGDDDWLKRLWPRARKSLEFCWIEGGWDADQDGVMEGCQHNTMDVEYYGPNPQMTGWYLGALRAAEEMARHIGEEAFAERCRALFESGHIWVDEHLFNGDYYEHEIRPPVDMETFAPGLRHETMGARDLKDPELQLGSGCLVDQLAGQYMAHVLGLGYLLDHDHIRRTLRSIMRFNYKSSFHAHFNHLRSYVMGDEAGLLMATYPKGRRPKRPFPYFNEVMTGFEYTAAVHMLYEGNVVDGLKVIRSIRERYDGRKRSPFDEAECGHHYARAMASWAGILAWTRFRYSAVEGSIQFKHPDEPVRWFWSTGFAWGTVQVQPERNLTNVTLRVHHGTLKVRELLLVNGEGCPIHSIRLDNARDLRTGFEETFRART